MRHLRVVLAPLAVLTACQPERSARDEEAVVAATRFAFSLEDSVATHRAELRTREALLALFEQGFEPPVTVRLTERLWDADRQEVRGTEQSIAAPDSVVVLAIDGDSATVAFTTPTNARWAPDAPYTVAWLQRRRGVWRVAGARDTSLAPAALPPPEPLPDGSP